MGPGRQVGLRHRAAAALGGAALVATGWNGLPAASVPVAGPAGPAVATPGAPEPPAAVAPYAGPGGVLVTWEAPRDGPAPASYEIQRATGTGGFVPVGTVATGAGRRLLDPLPATTEPQTYRVVATNAAGASEPSRARTVPSIPAAPLPSGVPNRLILTDPDGVSPWPGGLAFDGRADTVTVTRLNDREFEVRGVSGPGAPQGAREVAFTVGSAAYGLRVHRGSFPTVGPGAPNATLPALYPTTGGQCADRPGRLGSGGSVFAPDGTPLALDLSFDYCGAAGRILWNAERDVSGVLLPSAATLEFGPDGTGGERTLSLRNVGGAARTVREARLDDFAGQAPAGYAISSDACSGATLEPGASCALTVTAPATAAGLANARLRLLDPSHTPVASVLLTDGPAPPAPPRLLDAGRTWRAVTLTWQPGPADPPITSYTIYRGGHDNLTKLAEVPAAAHGTYVDRSGTPGTQYSYAVTATSAAGESARSAAVVGSPDQYGTFAATNRWSAGADRDIAVLGADGSPLRLTFDGGDHAEPAVATDNLTFAYAGNSGNSPADYDIWVQPPGAAPRRLTTGQDADRDPAFSYDGRTVAFTRVAADGSTSVWTVPTAGGAATPVPGTAGESQPAWAPSGRLLAVRHDAGDGTSSLLLTSLQGGYRVPLAGTVEAGARAADPEWSTGYERLISYIRTDAGSSRLGTANPFGGAAWSEPAGALTVRSHAGGQVVEGWSAASGSSLWTSPSTALPGSDHALFSQPALARPATGYTPHGVYGLRMLSSSIDDGRATLRWQLDETPNASCLFCARWTIVRRAAANVHANPRTPTDGVHVYDGTARTATGTGLTNGAAYAFSLFGLNAAGDLMGPVTWGATPAKPPVVSPNGSALGALAGGGPDFTATFGKPLPDGSNYELQIGTRTFDAAKKTWSAQPAWKRLTWSRATSKVVDATAGTTYHLRARVTDGGGHTPWGPVSVVPVPYDDRAFSASGTWSALTKQSGRFAGTVRDASRPGATLTMTAYGSSFGLVADVCPGCGQVKVYLDGKLRATVDTYAKSAGVRRRIWSADFSEIGSHTVKVVVVGTAKRPKVRIDGLVARR